MPSIVRTAVRLLAELRRRRLPVAFLIRTGLARLRSYGLSGMAERFEYWTHAFGVDESDKTYPQRVRQLSTLTDREINALRGLAQGIHGPMFSLLMPVGNPVGNHLRSAIESVIRQIYSNWELCVVGVACTDQHTRAVLAEYTGQDERVRVVFQESAAAVAAATARALEIARGDFIASFDAHDELREDALLLIAAEINADPDACLLYCDECQIDDRGLPLAAHFKPGWNPELLFGQYYVGNLLVARVDLVRDLGGFRPGFEGAYSHDLVLRLSTVCGRKGIQHIPYLLYRRRAPCGLVGGAERGAMEAGRLAVEDHLVTTGRPAEVRPGPALFTYRVKFLLPHPRPLVSIIIPTRNAVDVLTRCVNSLMHYTEYRDFEVLIIDNQTDEENARAYLKQCGTRSNFRILAYDRPFNYSAINNFAARHAQGAFLCLLNNDTEVITPEWLDELVMWGMQPGIGAVGAKLLYPDGTIQHAGITLGIMGLAGHAHKGFPAESLGYFNRLAVAHEVGAVTGACLLVAKAHYEAVGGMDAEHLQVAFNDVDLCLRLGAHGLRNIWTPAAVLYHRESKSRGWDDSREKRARFESEIDYMLTTWGDKLVDDPAYNPNLSRNREDFGLAWPQRVPNPSSHLRVLGLRAAVNR
jgi:O-antigen biosynthesis protein